MSEQHYWDEHLGGELAGLMIRSPGDYALLQDYHDEVGQAVLTIGRGTDFKPEHIATFSGNVSVEDAERSLEVLEDFGLVESVDDSESVLGEESRYRNIAYGESSYEALESRLQEPRNSDDRKFR